MLGNLFRAGWKYKNADIIYCMMTSFIFLEQANVKKSGKSMKIVNIEGENLHILWTTWWISMIFSGLDLW